MRRRACPFELGLDLLAVAATDFESNVLWTRQYSNVNWHDKAQFEDWANESYDHRYDDDDGTWHYGTAGNGAKAYELSSVGLYHEGELNKTVGTSACLWSFQMAPHRAEVFAPQAILQMDDYIYVERSPLAPTAQRCFGQSSPDISTYRVMGNVLWSVSQDDPPSGPWYTTCDSLAPFQPTSMTSSAPYFEGEWDLPQVMDAAGSHYGFADYDFTWFYILVEDSFPDGNESLIPNYIFVEDTGTTSWTWATDTNPVAGKYDWTEYTSLAGAPTTVSAVFGSIVGEDDFADDTPESGPGQICVTVDGGSWTLPQGETGETICIPLDVEYHWPEAEQSMTTAHKTVYAQKGIVVRVQVPEEIWAGESRPIFAVLNGKYHDGTSKVGDVPWSYDIVWEFAEPVWEEEGSGEDITYTPRPPDESQGEEIVPSTILTGAHRLKHDTSPLYVGDMTSSAGGLAYVRALIPSVSINNGEVVQGSGSTSVTSAWVSAFCVEELHMANRNGAATERLCIYSPEEILGTPQYTHGDHLEALQVFFASSLSPAVVDEIEVRMYDELQVLTETSANSNVFQNAEADFTITVNSSGFLNPDYVDAVNVTVSNDAYGLYDVAVDLIETGQDTARFLKLTYMVYLTFGGVLSESAIDHVIILGVNRHSGEQLEVTLQETGIATRVFADAIQLTRVEILSLTGMGDGTTDHMEILLTSYDLDATCVPCSLDETTASSLVFATHIVSSRPVIGSLPMTAQSAFKIVSKRWPGVHGETAPAYIYSSVDEAEATLAMDALEGIWISTSAWVPAPPDLASEHPDLGPSAQGGNDGPLDVYSAIGAVVSDIFATEYIASQLPKDAGPYEIAVLTTRWLKDRNATQDIPEMLALFRIGYAPYIGMQRARRMAARAWVHAYAVVGTTLTGQKNHISSVCETLNDHLMISAYNIESLGYFDYKAVLKDERDRMKHTLSHRPWYLYDVYYTTSHSVGISTTDHTFQGIALGAGTTTTGKVRSRLDDRRFGPRFSLQPTLVFHNACGSRIDPAMMAHSRAKLLFQKYNAKVYVGWEIAYEGVNGADIAYPYAPTTGNAFFDKLKTGGNVDEAIDAANRALDAKATQVANKITLEYYAGRGPDGNLYSPSKITLNKRSEYLRLISSW